MSRRARMRITAIMVVLVGPAAIAIYRNFFPLAGG